MLVSIALQTLEIFASEIAAILQQLLLLVGFYHPSLPGSYVNLTSFFSGGLSRTYYLPWCSISSLWKYVLLKSVLPKYSNSLSILSYWLLSSVSYSTHCLEISIWQQSWRALANLSVHSCEAISINRHLYINPEYSCSVSLCVEVSEGCAAGVFAVVKKRKGGSMFSTFSPSYFLTFLIMDHLNIVPQPLGWEAWRKIGKWSPGIVGHQCWGL